MNQYATRLLSALLTVSLLLPLAACGNETTAATMRLKRTEGDVAVSDDAGKDVPLLESLSLYSGYGVDTRTESYAWIDLDDVKLAKMDQESAIAIQKEGKVLDINVIFGSLFFNVTQPLEEDEAMDIRTSTMLVGIRGTCGWTEDRDGVSRVYLLEGTVECSAGGQTVQVNAGEMAELAADGNLKVEPFTVRNIPAFVQDELLRNPGLCSDIYRASGLDLLGTADGEEPDITEENTVEDTEEAKAEVEPLPELVNSEWYDFKLQIYDMVFTDYPLHMTEEDIRKVIDGSEYNVELKERAPDKNGNIYLDLMVDGEIVTSFFRYYYIYGYPVNDTINLQKFRLPDFGEYYRLMGRAYQYNDVCWYDKTSIEFKDLKTRDDVLAFLTENGFVEVEMDQAVYLMYKNTFYPGETDLADVPYYFFMGTDRIEAYRIYEYSETDEEMWSEGHYYSGAHWNIVANVSFSFKADGTIESVYSGTADFTTVLGDKIR